MPRPRTARRARAGVAVLALCATTALAVPAAASEPEPRTTSDATSAVAPTPECLDESLELSVEESRLASYLPDADDPTVPAEKTYSRTMIEGGGFGDYTDRFTAALCRTTSLDAATKLAERKGHDLWDAAVRRAQSPGAVRGDLPASDDRPLYWTRIEAMSVLRQWDPRGGLTDEERAELITTFDKAARGMYDIDLPPGDDVVRVIVSGFDIFTLDGGTTGDAPGTVGNNLRHGNPSGATALALDGTSYRTEEGKRAVIEAYVLPVSYREFEEGYLEDTVGPFMEPGPRQVDASLTVSQAGGSQFNLEQWNARFHGEFPGNDNLAPCAPTDEGLPQLPVDNPDCNIQVGERWGGGDGLHDPPQWTTASLPIEQMIAADTGADVPRPPGSTWPDESVAFGVVWNTNYIQFPDCTSPEGESVNEPEVEYPPATQPTPPAEGSCSYYGGGGNYLSNESAYRNTLLRDRAGLDIPAGHIHTPDMQHFETDFEASDPTFDAWRTSIVAQGTNLVHAVLDTVE